MVDITPPPRSERQVVQSYGGGGFRISGERYTGAVLVLPERTLAWPVSDPARLALDDFEALRTIEPGIELLLLGTGKTMCQPEPGLVAGIRAWGMVTDAMDTGAACRTYNVLLLEDRRVAAALLPVD